MCVFISVSKYVCNAKKFPALPTLENPINKQISIFILNSILVQSTRTYEQTIVDTYKRVD